MLSQPRSLTPFQKVINIGFNIRFILLGLFDSISKDNLATPGHSIHILGSQVQTDPSNTQRQNELLFKMLSETPWFTYRAGFPQLYHDLKGTYVTDTGWGCMIRVGQMAFAQMMRKHQRITNFNQMPQIINLFNDIDKSQPFSIHSISKLARKEYGILPGDWYNPSQIAHLLTLLNQTSLQSSLKLSFLVFNSGNLFYDQILQVMLGGKTLNNCNCINNTTQFVCTKCNKSQFSLGLILLARIGLDSPQQKYLSVLTEMMKISAFSGVIGGRPGKALYLIGSYGKNYYVYLDPHYVQQAQKNVQNIQQSYSCISFRVCKDKSIDPSFGICYYLRDLQELNKFYRQMTECKNKYQSDFFIWMSQSTPHYLSKSIRMSREIEIEEDYYQPL